MVRKRVKWSPEEIRTLDLSLKSFQDENGNYRWREIRRHFFCDRTDDSIRNFVKRRLQETKKSHNTSHSRNSSHVAWTPEEDQRISDLRKRGNKWVDLEAHFPGRTTQAIRNRYNRVHQEQKQQVSPQVPQSSSTTFDFDEQLFTCNENHEPIHSSTEILCNDAALTDEILDCLMSF